jgi:hypothetical protein
MAKSLSAVSKDVGQLQTRFNVRLALTFAHSLNELLRPLSVTLYPLIKREFDMAATFLADLGFKTRTAGR